MSYAAQPPVAAAPRRPVTVALAALLLAVMAVVGLGYAVATLAIAPGVVSRFRSATAGVDAADVDGLVTVVWVGAGIAAVLAVVLLALYVVLALGLRRGSNASRVATWVVCALGLLAGCGSTVTVLTERDSADAGGLGGALADAYPGGWMGLNLTLAIAQMLGYATVAGLLLASPTSFFGRGQATPAAAPGPYGSYGALPGMPGLYDAPASGPASPGPHAAPAQYGPPGPYGTPGQYGGSGPYGSPASGPPASGAPAYGQQPPGSQPYGRPPTEPGPDDEYWSRPSS